MPKKEVVVQFIEEGVSVSACNVSGRELIVGAYSILRALAQALGYAEGTEEFVEALQASIEVIQAAAGHEEVKSTVAELLESVGLTNEVDIDNKGV